MVKAGRWLDQCGEWDVEEGMRHQVTRGPGQRAANAFREMSFAAAISCSIKLDDRAGQVCVELRMEPGARQLGNCEQIVS